MAENNEEVDAHLVVTNKPKQTDKVIEIIQAVGHIPINNSIVIDVFDIGMAQTHMMEIYHKLSELGGSAMQLLSEDFVLDEKVKQTIDLGADIWKAGEITVKKTIATAASLDLETIKNNALEALQKQLDELTNVNLIGKHQVASIQLPLPNHLSDAINHNYTEDNLNLIESVINKGGSLLGGVAEQLIKADVKLAKRKNFTYDPHNIIVYQGTEFREYKFDIQLLPQDENDKTTIIKAVKYLKKYASAKNIALETADTFLSMSGIFRLRFPKMFNDILDIREEDMFYLTDIDMNYIGMDRLQRFHDGTPKHMILSLTFRERLPQYLNEKDKERLLTYKPAKEEPITETVMDNGDTPESTTPLAEDFIEDNTVITNDTPTSTTPLKQDENIWYGM